jgi:beta-lactam-binding protein with PASTA domain
VEQARKILKGAGFQVQVTHVFPWIIGGNVVAQSPNGTTKAPMGSTVTIAIR